MDRQEKRARGRGRKTSSRERVSVDEEARIRRSYDSNQISRWVLAAQGCNPSYLGV
jgi:hypothetical protein